MMRRFTSGPKPASRVRAFIVGDVVAVDAQAVAHAVVAGEVRRRLGRRDEVVRRQAVHARSARCTRSTVAPAFSSASAACSTAARTSGWMPSASVSSSTMPMRRPSTPRSTTGSTGVGRVGDRRGVERVVAGDHVEQQRGVGDGGGERADLVERARERDEAVARHQPVGGLHADDAAQRGGLADRAAGVGAEPERRVARPRPRPPTRRSSRRARVTGRAGCGWARTPSSRWTSPSRTRRGWSCRPGTAPGARRAARRRWPCRAGASPSRMRDEHVVATPRVQRLSLSTIGHAGERAGVVAAADRGVDRVGRGRAPTSSSDQVARVQLRLACVDDGEVLLDDVARRDRVTRAHRRPRSPARRLTAPRGCAARGTGRLRRRAPSRAPRRDRGSAARSSGRSTLTSGSGCAVGGTSSVSSAGDLVRRARGSPRARR